MKKALSILLVFTLFVTGCSSGASNDKEQHANLYAREFVKQHLKSPKSADFCSFSETKTVKQSDGSWIISSCVDSENSFGAMLRMKYIAQLKYNEKNETWNLMYLDFE